MLELLDDEAARGKLKPEITEMEKIVASLLEAERLSHRHDTLARTQVRIGELINDLVDDFFDRQRDRLIVDNRAGGLTCEVDEARITLLLKNLISNAMRYTSRESGPIELAVFQRNSELILRVSDQGPGMSKEQAGHLGEPFYRGDPSRTRDTGGTGLGLYLATMIAEAHGGELQLLNPGEPGARFECRIPI
jgi:signal transduction histidine kinase